MFLAVARYVTLANDSCNLSRNAIARQDARNLKGQFHGFAHVQALALAVVNFTVSY